MRTCDTYQPLIILASLGTKVQSPHGREKCLSSLKGSKDKFPYSIANANSSIDLCSRLPTKMLKEDKSSKHSNFYLFSS